MSSYASISSDTDDWGYDYDTSVYDYEDDHTGLFGGNKLGKGGLLGIGLLGGIIPVIIAVVVLIVVIAIIVELKNLNNSVSLVKGRSSWGWLDSITDTLNEVDSERIVRRMFPGGFPDVIQSIESAYRKYRGLDLKKLEEAKAKTNKQKKLATENKL